MFQVGLVIYCAVNGDIYRIVNGYDSCGNVCGRITERQTDPRFACTGRDLRAEPYLLIREAGKANVEEVNVHRECVDDCSTYEG